MIGKKSVTLVLNNSCNSYLTNYSVCNNSMYVLKSSISWGEDRMYLVSQLDPMPTALLAIPFGIIFIDV